MCFYVAGKTSTLGRSRRETQGLRRLNADGFSLIEVMVVAALLAAGAITFSTLAINGQKAQNNVKFLSEADSFNEEVRALLSSEKACKNTFGGQDISAVGVVGGTGAGTPVNVDTLQDDRTTDDSGAAVTNGVTRYKKFNPVAVPPDITKYGSDRLRLTQISIDKLQKDATTNKAQIELTLALDSVLETAGPGYTWRKMNLALELDGSGKIMSCIALAKMSDGIWKRTTATFDNIYFKASSVGLNQGYVGIGTATPAYILDILTPTGTTGSAVRIRGANVNGGVGLILQNDIAGGKSWTLVSSGGSSAPAGTFSIYENGVSGAGADRLVVAAGGNVGIGTVTPSDTLEIMSPNGAAGISLRAASTSPNDPADFIFKNFDETNRARIHSGQYVTPSLDFMVGTDSTAPAKLTILENGNVGIGESAPKSKLEVAGEVKIGDSGVACNTTVEGAIRYDFTAKVMKYCNATNWVPFGGSTGSTAPICRRVVGSGSNPYLKCDDNEYVRSVFYNTGGEMDDDDIQVDCCRFKN